MDLSLEHRTEQFDALRMGGPPSSKYSILSSHPVEQIVEKVRKFYPHRMHAARSLCSCRYLRIFRIVSWFLVHCFFPYLFFSRVVVMSSNPKWTSWKYCMGGMPWFEGKWKWIFCRRSSGFQLLTANLLVSIQSLGRTKISYREISWTVSCSRLYLCKTKIFQHNDCRINSTHNHYELKYCTHMRILFQTPCMCLVSVCVSAVPLNKPERQVNLHAAMELQIDGRFI